MSILVAGGGTAGHIEPAMNLADELRRRNPDLEIFAVGTAKGLETRLVPARGYDLELISPVPLPRRINKDLFTLPIRLRRTIKQVRKIMRERNVEVVVGFGGYVALPVYLAARGRVPIIVHEANARPGLANKVGARFAQTIAQTYAGSLPNGVQTGLPLRKSFEELNREERRSQARSFFNLPDSGSVLLVFGGSQGARRINSAIAELVANTPLDFHILHAVGLTNELPEATSNYHPVSYIDQMDMAYSAADFVISRSGAMTVAEVAAVAIPACFVPFPIGNGEQELNARPLVEAGGALMCADGQFSSDYILENILPILNDEERLSEMTTATSRYRIENAAEKLALIVETALRTKGSKK